MNTDLMNMLAESQRGVLTRHVRDAAKTRYVQLAISDTRLDQKGACWGGKPINVRSILCPECGFLDLDTIPQPYFVLRGPAMTPAEIREACHGEMLVKERVKRIIEFVAPGECHFFPTCFLGTTELSPWWLAVPVNRCRTGIIKSAMLRCPLCGEPVSGQPGLEYQEWRTVMDAPGSLVGELFLSSNWHSVDHLLDAVRRGGWKGRSLCTRDFVVSVRLYRLMRELRVAGVYEFTGDDDKETPPTWDEIDWVIAQIARLQTEGIPVAPPGLVNPDSKKWFKKYLDSNLGDGWDLSGVIALEKKHRMKFPKSYLQFAECIGRKEFNGAGTVELGKVAILVPSECDFQSFRKGELDTEDEDSADIDAVMFATGEFGDHLCFDIRKGRNESAVLVYQHEYNSFEPYAENFVECLRRLSAVE